MPKTTTTKKQEAPAAVIEAPDASVEAPVVPEAPASVSFLGDIISTQESTKQAFAQNKKAEREALYQMADTMIERIIGDGKEYTGFLNMQAQLAMGVNNTALLLAQRPSATLLHTYGEWKDKGVMVTDYDNPVRLLISETYSGTRTIETPNAYGEVEIQQVKYDGRGTNVAEYYDVMQTNQPFLPERPQLDSQEKVQVAIKAMLQVSRVSVGIDNSLTQPEYVAANRQIRLSESLTPSETFRQLAVGCAHAHIAGGAHAYQSGNYTLEAYSVAHILCKRYGAAHNEMDFSGAPNWFASLASHNPGLPKESLNLVNRIAKTLGKAIQRDLSPPTQQRDGQRRNQPTR